MMRMLVVADGLDLAPLYELFKDERGEVFHAAQQDLEIFFEIRALYQNRYLIHRLQRWCYLATGRL
jgi:ribonuclease D